MLLSSHQEVEGDPRLLPVMGKASGQDSECVLGSGSPF